MSNLESELENKIKQAEMAELQSEFLAASICYKEAMEIAQKFNQSKELKELKGKFIAASKKINFNQLAFEQKIPIAILNEFVDSIIKEGDDITLILKKIGQHPYLYPKKNAVLERAKKTMPVTYNIVNLITYSPNGHIIEGGGDPVLAWYTKIYGLNQEFINNLYLRRLFDTLKTRKKFDSDTLFTYIEQQKTFTFRSLPIIKVGIERYFAGDYISALHILVPQFESAFLIISEKLGIDIIAIKMGAGTNISTLTRTLSDRHLDSPEFIKIWGEDFCEQIKYVFFDQLGDKLRHKIAHGEIDLNECGQVNTELVIYFFLVIAGRVEIKPKSKNAI